MPLPGNMQVVSAAGAPLNADLINKSGVQTIIVQVPAPEVVEVEKIVEVEVKPSYDEADLKKMTKKDLIEMLTE